MKISRRSPRTGKIHTMDLDITKEQWHNWAGKLNPPLIQDAFPNLTPAEREFILTGLTQKDWEAIFPPDQEEESQNERYQD